MSVALVGFMLVAALHAVGAAKTRQTAVTDYSRGRQLAQSMINEILAQPYAELMTADGNVLLREFTGSMKTIRGTITPTLAYAQYFKPRLPENALSWRLTRFEIRRKEVILANEALKVRLHLPDADKMPSTTAVEQLTVPGNKLPQRSGWYAFTFSDHSGLDPQVGLCVALTTSSNPAALNFEYQIGDVFESDTALIEGDPNWHTASPSMTMIYRAYGNYEIALGIDPGEDSGNRENFNDVDDYNGWSASPPQDPSGTVLKGLEGWKRQVEVAWVDPSNLGQVVGAESSLKRITVSVYRGNVVAAKLVAVRSAGLQPPQLCCFDDASKQELPAQICTDWGGRPQGLGTKLACHDCPPPPRAVKPLNVLFVSNFTEVFNLLAGQFVPLPNPQDQAKIDLLTAWGHHVELIDGTTDPMAYTHAFGRNDVAYVSLEVDYTDVAKKLIEAPIGLVNEEIMLAPYLGFSTGTGTVASMTDTVMMDNRHEITSDFVSDDVQLTTSGQPLSHLQGTLSPDLLALTTHPTSGYPALSLLDTEARMTSSGQTTGRRVMLPWGGDTFNFNTTTTHAKTIMRRSIDWAGGGTQLDSALVARWKFDENNEIIAADSIGTHDATLVSGASRPGAQLRESLYLDGNNGYALVNDSPALSLLDQLTLMAWIYKNSRSGWDLILNKGASGSNQNYWLGTIGDELSFGFHANSFQEFTTAGANIPKNHWKHVVATFDNATGEVHLYLDGRLKQSWRTSQAPLINEDDLYIGRSQYGEYWDGQIKDLRIYNRVLREREIETIFLEGNS